jgi:hypothetical protein
MSVEKLFYVWEQRRTEQQAMKAEPTSSPIPSTSRTNERARPFVGKGAARHVPGVYFFGRGAHMRAGMGRCGKDDGASACELVWREPARSLSISTSLAG